MPRSTARWTTAPITTSSCGTRGTGAAAGRFYWISPNAGSTWDIEIAVFGPGSAILPATPGAGCNGKLAYVAALKGFVLLPHAGTTLYFLRTA